ncbi:hypothetical protein BDZ97DRAFT_2062743 [Flammula alnicola]|nr:hypothetical protein BDZ97DRAFT_2062743 [Flammula alnicola]
MAPALKYRQAMLESLADYDPHECSVSSTQPCNACAKLIELDAAIDRQLADLIEKRRALKTQVNHHHSPLIHRLPSEIASHVFTLYVESVNDRLLSKKPFNEADGSPPLLLASVCKTWRETALATPRLWASAHIFLYDSDLQDLKAELVKQWLDRSGQLPLSITLIIDPPEFDRALEKSFSRLFDIVRQYSHRWHSLTLYCDMRYNHYIIGDLMQAPMLQTICLLPDYYSMGSTFHLPETPSLHHFEINSDISLSDVVVQWDNLTYFEGYSNSPGEILTILYAARRLVTGKFHSVRKTSNEGFPESAAHVTHTSLKHLCISTGLNDPRLFSLINLLDFPSLESFDFDSPLPPFPKDELISLLTRSQSPLVSLDIRVYDNDQDLIDLLEKLPSITDLSISYVNDNVNTMTDEFLNRLALELGFLPHLEVLRFTGIRNVAWSSLLGIIEGPLQDAGVQHPYLHSPIDNTTPAGIERKRRLRCMGLTFTGTAFYTSPDDYIDKDVLLSLVRFREAGVAVEILRDMGGIIHDLIQLSLSYHSNPSGRCLLSSWIV